jgi:hypothetical protein
VTLEEILIFLASEFKRENIQSWSRAARAKSHPVRFTIADAKKKNEETFKFLKNAWEQCCEKKK